MKSIQLKSFAFALLIAMSVCASLDRATRTKTKTATKTATKSETNTDSKTKTKYDGNGSWTGGYNAPFIKLHQNGNLVATSGKYSFNASKFSGSLGWIFTMDNMPAEIQKVTQKTPQGEDYVPWRYFNTIGYGKLTWSYKYMYGNLKNDNNESFTIEFYLPWRSSGDYITYDQCIGLRGDIAKWGTAQKQEIITSKAQVNNALVSMTSAKKALDTQKEDAAALKAKIEAEIAQKKTQVDGHKATLKTTDAAIIKLSTEIQGLTAQIETIENTINNDNLEVANNDKLIDDTERAKVMATLDTKITDELNDVGEAITSLAHYCRNVNMAPIKTAAEKGDDAALDAGLKGIAPATNN